MTARRVKPILQSEVLALFEYQDGKLIWLVDRQLKVKGTEAGYMANSGYRLVRFNKSYFLVHRIIFCMHHGFTPEKVDHIDGDTSNNRIENLREASHSENICNAKLRSTNTSGHKGVYWSKVHQKWITQIKKDGVADIKYFNNADDAVASIKAQRIALHGEFANHG